MMALYDIYVSDSENRKYFISYFITSIISSVLYFISFVSPYWIVADWGALALFKRIGLWTVCFDGYMRPDQYFKAYYGCYYIYYVEYDYIRDWLNPLWFYCTQVMASLGLLLEAIVLYFILCQVTGRFIIEDLTVTRLLMLGHFIAGFSLLCTILGFTYGRYDSRWVPYPRYNKFSWAFYMAIICLLLIILSFSLMLVFYLKVHMKIARAQMLNQNWNQDEDDEVPIDDDRNIEDELQKLASTSASRIYSQPSGYLGPHYRQNDDEISSEVVEDLGDSHERVTNARD